MAFVPQPSIIIVTRFSIRWNGVLPSKEWINDRFELLKHITHPSLSHQTVQDFVWVVLTAPEWHEYVADLFRPVTLPNGIIKVVTPGVKSEALQDIQPEAERFITFRLDSDDALAVKAIERVLATNAQVGDEEILFNLPSGVQLEWTTGEMFYRTFRPHFQGPFLAIRNMSRDRMLNTGGNHTQARASFKVVDVAGLNWVQVIHGGNLFNRIRYNIKPQPTGGTPEPRRLNADVAPVPDSIRQNMLAEFGMKPNE